MTLMTTATTRTVQRAGIPDLGIAPFSYVEHACPHCGAFDFCEVDCARVLNGKAAPRDRVVQGDSSYSVDAPERSGNGGKSSTARRNANKYPGKCTKCGSWVEADAGERLKVGARWTVHHLDGACPTKEAPKATAVKQEAPRQAPATPSYVPAKGDVHVVDGRYLRVSISRSSGRPYTNEWTGTSWEYAPGFARKLSAATLATVEQVAAFGHAYERCVFCSRDLDLPESIEAGYGSICAGKRGLPWGQR